VGRDHHVVLSAEVHRAGSGSSVTPENKNRLIVGDDNNQAAVY
jgi:hypothetical protein